MKLEDVKKLAEMARIDMSDIEMETMAKDFDPILAYVGQVQEVLKSNNTESSLKKDEDYLLHNIMREDIATNKTGGYTEQILANAPDTQGGFLKVKQIL